MFMFCLLGISSSTINMIFYILCMLPKTSLELTLGETPPLMPGWLRSCLWLVWSVKTHESSDYSGALWSTAVSADKMHKFIFATVLHPCQLWTREVTFWAWLHMGGVLPSGRLGCSLQGVAASVVVLMLEAGESCPVSSWWDSAFTLQMLHSQ